MRAVILAGGLGERLRTRVPDIPKPMGLVAGRPFLEYVLDGLISHGLVDLILSVGYRAEFVRAHFGDVYRCARICYAVENEPLGTGGAIANALRGFPSDPALVVNGDTLLDVDFRDVVRWYEAQQPQVGIVLREASDVARYGAVICDERRVIAFTEKGRSGKGLVNAGVYVLRPSVFHAYGLSGKFSLESDLLQSHCVELDIRGYVMNGFFIDIGVPEDFDRAQVEMYTIRQ